VGDVFCIVDSRVKKLSFRRVRRLCLGYEAWLRHCGCPFVYLAETLWVSFCIFALFKTGVRSN
jgi:hypothetical protein